MNPKLKFLIPLLLVTFLLAGCACSAQPSATPTPKPSDVVATPMPSPSMDAESTATPWESPEASMDPESSAAPDASMTPETSDAPDATGGPEMMGIDVAKLITELEKLSEVDTADVVAMEGKAVVALHFDQQYQGTLTDRIEEMAVSALTNIESALTDVAVTADPALAEEIQRLHTEMGTNAPTDDQRAWFNDLYNKIKPASADANADTPAQP